MIELNLNIPDELYTHLEDKAVRTVTRNNIRVRSTFRVRTVRVPHPTNPTRTVSEVRREWTHTFRNEQTNGTAVAGGLNFLYDYIHDYGYAYTKTEGTKYFFENEKGHVMIYDTANGGFGEETTRENYKWSVPTSTGGVRTTFNFEYTHEELAAALNTSVEKLDEMRRDNIFYFETVDTSTQIANAFSTQEIEGDTITAQLFINGKDFTEFNPNLGFDVDWVLYNGSLPDRTISPTHGNFGESARVRIEGIDDPKRFTVNVAETTETPYYDADTHTFYYNADKVATIGFEPVFGKGTQYVSLLNIQSGKVYQSRVTLSKDLY